LPRRLVKNARTSARLSTPTSIPNPESIRTEEGGSCQYPRHTDCPSLARPAPTLCPAQIAPPVRSPSAAGSFAVSCSHVANLLTCKYLTDPTRSTVTNAQRGVPVQRLKLLAQPEARTRFPQWRHLRTAGCPLSASLAACRHRTADRLKSRTREPPSNRTDTIANPRFVQHRSTEPV
jgi:hypothetical protein